MNGLTIGRMVHYVDAEQTHSAAVVSAVLNKELGEVDLTVFTNDLWYPVKIVRNVPFHAGAHVHTWHWIEPA